ncbi:MAG TPA: rhomboid family intramembrane serine protease [Xanthobacteraceae bacterium]|jgi:rhomboid protease GluP
MVVGAIVSDLSHSQPYIAVGASGAISGILGALLRLWILGKIDLSANFFAINIGLNVALALSSSKLDWAAHFGGFTAGLIACALIDVLERVNRFAFRCRFPQFVKVNSLVLVGALGALLWGGKPNGAAFGSS